MSMLDSAPVFESRLLAAGVEAAHVALITAAGITSLAKLAFLTSCQPGIGDDKPLLDEVAKILQFDAAAGNPMPLAVASTIRRVWFEAHSVAMAEVRNKIERSEESQPRKLPLPEREARRSAQPGRLSGILIEGALEPSCSLIDFVFTMREDEQVKYLDPSLCTNRESEIKGIKKESFVKLETNGVLKAVQRDVRITADIGSEYKLKMALQRRSLALDQLDLAVYLDSEK